MNDIVNKPGQALIATTPEDVSAQFEFTIEGLRQKLSEPLPTAIESATDYDTIRKAIAVRRSLRGEIDATRERLNELALRHQRTVNAYAKDLITVVVESETPLKTLKAAEDARREAVKQAKAEAERARLEAEARAEREAEEARLRAEREAEEARLAEERAALAAERARVEAEQRTERERLAAEREALEAERAAADAARRAEESRLAAEREAAEAVARAEREQVAAAQRAERERLADERLAFEAEQQRARDEQAARERAERARIAAEEAAVAEAERQAALAARLEALKPDAAKLRAWSDELLAITGPDVADEAAREAVIDALRWIGRAREELNDFLARVNP